MGITWKVYMLTQIQPMFGNRVLRIIRKGETNVPPDKIGHSYENTFGKDSKKYTNDKYGPAPVISQKKNWDYDTFLWYFLDFFRTGNTVKRTHLSSHSGDS